VKTYKWSWLLCREVLYGEPVNLNIEYPESMEEAAQIARAALPLASKYALPVNPITYAVLYEYVAGNNPQLKAALDQLCGRDDGISPEQVLSQYKDFVLDGDEEALGKVRQALVRVMASTQESLSKVGEESQTYSENLGAAAEELQGDGDLSSAADIIARLIDETAHMQATSQSLQDELAKTNEDLAKLRTEFKRVRHESMVDSLTGIQNRRAFDQALTESCEQARSNKQPLCLLLVDIDHFKKVNDNYGHVVGDAVLKGVSETLNDTVRGGDILARYGGEEFVAVLPNTPMDGAERVADNICNMVRNQEMDENRVGKNVGRVTVSVGVALFHAAESPEDFVTRADIALYRAKESGRNRVCTHTVE
jgi:diguanylate cyclase